MTCDKCGEKPKKTCGAFPRAVIEIDNPEQITLLRKVIIPASMGDDTTMPPAVGKYHNVLLYYEANSKSYLYSSDGIPTQLVNGVTDYEQAVNLPQINGVTLLGDKSAADLELADAPMVITVAAGNASWSGADTAEDVYNFFLNKGKVNIVFSGGENYAYEIASAGYIPEEEKMMCTLAVATIVSGEPTEFDGNAIFGIMTLYTAGKAVDVSQIELQPKLFVTDFTGLDFNYNELSGVPATDTTIGMVKPGDGLEVDANGTIDAKAGRGIEVDSNGISISPLYIDGLEVIKYNYVDNGENTNTNINYVIIPVGNKPKMVMSDPNNPDNGATASEIDYKYKPTVMSNLSAWDTSTHTTYGPLIIDGNIKVENNLGSGTYWNRPIVGIDTNGRMYCINGSTPANEVNMNYACRAWACIYNDGSTNPDITNTKEPRTFLAQDYDGNYLIGVCGGRQADDTGMGLTDILNFIRTEINFNAKLIFNMDGGGSSNLLFHGIRQNKLVSREDRVCPNWLVWSTDSTIGDGIYKSQSIVNLNNIKQEIDEAGHIISYETINNDMIGGERITATATARIMKITPRTICYNVNFNITGEGNLSAYSDLFTHLPRTQGNIYTIMLKHDGYTQVPVQLKDESTYSRLRNLTALAPGTYSFNFTVFCDTQY